MNKQEPSFINLVLIIWSLLMAVAVALTLTTPTSDKNKLYDEQIKATELSLSAMKSLNEYRDSLGIPLSLNDTYSCGLIGDRWSTITTTSGLLEAKKTSINPNFAAVFVDMFREAGLRGGEQVGLIMSGSFPALNISAMAALQTYKLDPCIMVSIGASSYGANNPQLTYFDMAEYLWRAGVFTNRIDYVSLGGSNDAGDDFFSSTDKEAIMSRIDTSGITFINESNYAENIALRTEKIIKKCPDIKLLINIGGNLVSMGKDEDGFTGKNGLIVSSYLKVSEEKSTENMGLLDTFLSKGVNVIQMLNIKGIALEYGLKYNAAVIPEVGEGDVYYEEVYNLGIPIFGIVISIGLGIFYYYYRRKIMQLT